MSWFTSTRLVVERELREAFRRRSLWVVFAILFIGSSVAMILPEILDSGTTQYHVALDARSPVATSEEFQAELRQATHALDATVRFRTTPDAARARTLVDDDDVDLAVVGADQPVVVVRSGDDDTLVALVRQALASRALQQQLQDAGLDTATINRVLRAPGPRVDEIAGDDSDRRATAAILSLVVYLVLLILMIQAANGVAIEKANRISEVLLAVVRPSALFFGKVVGVALVGLAGLAAGAIPVVVKVIAGGDLPAGLGPALAGGLPWMVLGLALYLTSAGALGALVERQEDAGSILAPLSLLLIGTYILAQSSSDDSVGAVLAIFPFTSPIIMPSRIALGVTSAPEVIASLVVGVATLLLVVRLGSIIYRRGIVQTGRKMRVSEVLRAA